MAWSERGRSILTGKRLKKWLMLQMWRFQQVAQPITLVLLAANLAVQLFNFVKWRGAVLGNFFTAVPLIMLILMLIMWAFAIIWDLRLKMWRDQATVLVERNPYTKEKLSAKEMAQYNMIWIPFLEELGKDSKKLADTAEVLKKWVKKASEDDRQLIKDLDDLLRHIGDDKIDVSWIKDKKKP